MSNLGFDSDQLTYKIEDLVTVINQFGVGRARLDCAASLPAGAPVTLVANVPGRPPAVGALCPIPGGLQLCGVEILAGVDGHPAFVRDSPRRALAAMIEMYFVRVGLAPMAAMMRTIVLLESDVPVGVGDYRAYLLSDGAAEQCYSIEVAVTYANPPTVRNPVRGQADTFAYLAPPAPEVRRNPVDYLAAVGQPGAAGGVTAAGNPEANAANEPRSQFRGQRNTIRRVNTPSSTQAAVSHKRSKRLYDVLPSLAMNMGPDVSVMGVPLSDYCAIVKFPLSRRLFDRIDADIAEFVQDVAGGRLDAVALAPSMPQLLAVTNPLLIRSQLLSNPSVLEGAYMVAAPHGSACQGSLGPSSAMAGATNPLVFPCVGALSFTQYDVAGAVAYQGSGMVPPPSGDEGEGADVPRASNERTTGTSEQLVRGEADIRLLGPNLPVAGGPSVAGVLKLNPNTRSFEGLPNLVFNARTDIQSAPLTSRQLSRQNIDCMIKESVANGCFPADAVAAPGAAVSTVEEIAFRRPLLPNFDEAIDDVQMDLRPSQAVWGDGTWLRKTARWNRNTFGERQALGNGPDSRSTLIRAVQTVPGVGAFASGSAWPLQGRQNLPDLPRHPVAIPAGRHPRFEGP